MEGSGPPPGKVGQENLHGSQRKERPDRQTLCLGTVGESTRAGEASGSPDRKKTQPQKSTYLTHDVFIV